MKGPTFSMEAQVLLRSEAGQGILCPKEDIGKYDMCYGVVCKTVMSSCMSVGCSLDGGHVRS